MVWIPIKEGVLEKNIYFDFKNFSFNFDFKNLFIGKMASNKNATPFPLDRTESVSLKRHFENNFAQKGQSYIRTIKKFVLTKEKHIGYQAQVILINNQLYMGLTKMWYNNNTETWHPSRKSIFLPKPAFEFLMAILPEISNLMSFPPNGYIPVGPTYTPSMGPIEEPNTDSF